jgi:hypothetical protein
LDIGAITANANRIKGLERQLHTGKSLRNIAMVLIALLLITLTVLFSQMNNHFGVVIAIIVVILVTLGLGFYVFTHSRTNEALNEKIDLLKIDGYRMMKPANSLYSSTVFTEIFTKHYGNMVFSNYINQNDMQI